MKSLLLLLVFSCSCTPWSPHEPLLFHTRAASGWRCPEEPTILCLGKRPCTGSEQKWIARCIASKRVYKCRLGGRSNSTCLETASSRKKALTRSKKPKPVYTDEEQSQMSAIAEEEQKQDLELRKQGKLLVLRAFDYKREYDRIMAKGEVKNISDGPVNGLVPLVSFYSADRKRIKTVKGLLTTHPLKPGQTSAFNAQVGYHPLMRYSAVTFSDATGKAIPAGEYPK
jgi:hypothetical protein